MSYWPGCIRELECPLMIENLCRTRLFCFQYTEDSYFLIYRTPSSSSSSLSCEGLSDLFITAERFSTLSNAYWSVLLVQWLYRSPCSANERVLAPYYFPQMSQSFTALVHSRLKRFRYDCSLCPPWLLFCHSCFMLLGSYPSNASFTISWLM